MTYYRRLLRCIEVLAIIVAIVAAFSSEFTSAEKGNFTLICLVMIIFVEAMLYITRNENRD